MLDDQQTNPLTVEQIMSRDRFDEAVTRGGMDKRHYARLCAMALCCIELTEDEIVTFKRIRDALHKQ